jgi:hypothetical protein
MWVFCCHCSCCCPWFHFQTLEKDTDTIVLENYLGREMKCSESMSVSLKDFTLKKITQWETFSEKVSYLAN